ncbi:MAG TPA: flavin reductase family protein [Dongiaceae bacterium]|nr:flavin reductase family protein [Dongiaceae bacterium]
MQPTNNHHIPTKLHQIVEPSILYFGTPVVLVSTLNPDGTTNIAPMSSAWWLGWSCVLGLDGSSRTTENLRRHGECVLNLAAADNVAAVDRLALLTGSKSVPLHKRMLGYRYAADKFAEAGLTPQLSELVQPQRILECPVQMEATVASIAPLGRRDSRMAVPACTIEVTIQRIHAHGELLKNDNPHHVDPLKWRPLMMSFRRFFSLTDEIHDSRLGRGPEETYAPWKLTGLRRHATDLLLKLANQRYDK